MARMDSRAAARASAGGATAPSVGQRPVSAPTRSASSRLTRGLRSGRGSAEARSAVGDCSPSVAKKLRQLASTDSGFSRYRAYRSSINAAFAPYRNDVDSRMAFESRNLFFESGPVIRCSWDWAPFLAQRADEANHSFALPPTNP